MAQLRQMSEGLDKSYLEWFMPFFELTSEIMIAVKEDRKEEAQEKAKEFLKYYISFLDKVIELYRGEEIVNLVVLRE